MDTGAIFRAVEVFADRYTNVALTGLQNSQFVIAKWEWPAFFLNTRVYSCTLIKNDLALTGGRWRGRYNEDTDLCIRALKEGWCTVVFVTFNADKVGTMVMKGGNTDELYAGNGRTLMAHSLMNQHPDVVKVGTRWNRDQHIVNYPACVEIGKRSAPNGCTLQLKKGVIPTGVDNFGMVLCARKTGERKEAYEEIRLWKEADAAREARRRQTEILKRYYDVSLPEDAELISRCMTDARRCRPIYFKFTERLRNLYPHYADEYDALFFRIDSRSSLLGVAPPSHN